MNWLTEWYRKDTSAVTPLPWPSWPGCHTANEGKGRALVAAAMPNAPNNRKDQLGRTLELQLCCLDWTPPLLLPSSPCRSPPFLLQPPSNHTLPHHVLAHILGLFSAWIYRICSRKPVQQGLLLVWVCQFAWRSRSIQGLTNVSIWLWPTKRTSCLTTDCI